MYTALYRRYRPRTFDEIVGQDHIVKILKKQIQTGNIAHAYLFCGTRGTGKTSAARIFAKGVNCLSEGERPCGKCENCESIQRGIFFDVIEIDAASNNRVDNIRELRESVKYPPAAGLCKVYIIDEVHMLSTGAFNALLKTLEEPPKNVIFVLATTEPHKLPATILSRCLRLDFRRVPEAKIKEKLIQICDEQGIKYEESALSLIASNGDGSVRDSLSILEQCLPAGEKSLFRKDVVDILGTVGEEVFLNITEKVIENNTAEAFQIIDKIAKDGKDIRQFIKDWIFHFRNLMMSKYADKLEDIMNMSCENVEKVRMQGETTDVGFISAAISELSATANKARYSANPRILLELSVMKLSAPTLNENIEALLQRIEKLEKSLLNNGKCLNKESINETVVPCEKSNSARETEDELPPWDEPDESKIIKTEDVRKNNINVENIEKPILRELDDDRKTESASKVFGNISAEKNIKKENDDLKHERNSLWNKVLSMAIKERPQLRILNKNVNMMSINEKIIVLGINSAMQKTVLEQNNDVFEKYLEQITGKTMKIQIVMSTQKDNYSNDASDDTRYKLKALLGEDKLTFTK